MSRSDQYIGLTRDAESYVSGLERISDVYLEGAFGSRFMLGIWQGPDGKLTEVVQDSPWSSGPMFFTCLKLDFSNDFSCQIFCWVLNPTVRNYEFDYERGHYWV